MLVHLREAPDLLRAGLETITESTIRSISAAAALGSAGPSEASPLASARAMSEAEYRAFGEPYDRRVLAEVQDCWFTIGHLHGPNPMFELAARYPIQALNWHDRESPPSLAQGQEVFQGAVSGGLEHWEDLLRGGPDQIRARVADAIAQTAGQRLIVSSGCVAPVNAPFSNLRAVRQAVESAAT
jgi:uroporphyrinogen decarboxylase